MCLQIAYSCLMESDFPHLLILLPLSLVVVAVGYSLIVTKQAKEKKLFLIFGANNTNQLDPV